MESRRVYNNAQVAIRAHFLEGMRHGLYEAFNQEGSPQLIAQFSNDLQEGLYTSWYSNGQLKLKAFYSAGLPDGEYLEWHPNGQPKLAFGYVKGLLEGNGFQWSLEGNVIFKAYFLNNRPEGEWVLHDDQWISEATCVFQEWKKRRDGTTFLS